MAQSSAVRAYNHYNDRRRLAFLMGGAHPNVAGLQYVKIQTGHTRRH